jgi:hypothetical protein
MSLPQHRDEALDNKLLAAIILCGVALIAAILSLAVLYSRRRRRNSMIIPPFDQKLIAAGLTHAPPGYQSSEHLMASSHTGNSKPHG